MRLTATRDLLDQSVIFSAGAFGFEEYVYLELTSEPFRGRWSKQTKQIRVDLAAGYEAVEMLRRQGHHVVLADAGGGHVGEPDGPLECRDCGAPYPRSHRQVPGEACAACGAVLVLIGPHRCSYACHEAAADRGAQT